MPLFILRQPTTKIILIILNVGTVGDGEVTECTNMAMGFKTIGQDLIGLMCGRMWVLLPITCRFSNFRMIIIPIQTRVLKLFMRFRMELIIGTMTEILLMFFRWALIFTCKWDIVQLVLLRQGVLFVPTDGMIIFGMRILGQKESLPYKARQPNMLMLTVLSHHH